MIRINLDIGDIILVGRFKNKRIKVKEIGTDEHGLPTVNGRSILKIRIEKLMEPKNKSVKEAILNKSWKQLIGKSVTLIDTLIVTDYKTNKNIKLNPGDIVKIIDSARANSNIKDDVAFIEFKGKIYVSTPEPLLNKSNLNEENMKTKKNLKESSDIERQITKYIQKKFAFRSNLLDKNSSEEDVEYYAQQIQQDLKIPDYNYQFIISCLKKYYNIRESKQFKLANIAKKILKENSNEVDQLFKFLDHPWQEDGEIEFVSLLDQNRGNFKTSNWAATLRYLRGMDKANSNLSMMASDKFLTMWDDLIK